MFYGPQSLSGLRLLHWWTNLLFYTSLILGVILLLVINRKYNGGILIQDKNTPMFDFVVFTCLGMIRRGLEAIGVLPIDIDTALGAITSFGREVLIYFN
jgi:hypothetical protein